MFHVGRWAVATACVLAFGLSSANSRGAETYFEFTANGGWIAYDYTEYRVEPSDGWTFTPQVRDRTMAEFRIFNNDPNAPSTPDYWSLSFFAPLGEELGVGRYDGAERFSDVGVPGLRIGSTGRGSNSFTGWFEIFEVEFTTEGSVSRFSADFTVFEEGAGPNNGIEGSIRFNAVGASAVPEPSSLALAGVGVASASAAGLRERRRRGRRQAMAQA